MTAMRYARPLLYAGRKGKRAIPSLFSMPMMPLPCARALCLSPLSTRQNFL
jgi:hypothetical protein